MEKLFAKTESQNSKIAQLILNNLKQREVNLLLLKGKLGAGKTAITREITKILNSKQLANSPTFVIQKIYQLNKNKFGYTKVIHIDLYRISDYQDIKELGIEEDLQDKSTLVIIEWPERYNFDKLNNITVEVFEKRGGRMFVIKQPS